VELGCFCGVFVHINVRFVWLGVVCVKRVVINKYNCRFCDEV